MTEQSKFTEQYTTRFQRAEPSYYERMPAIIDYLTYIDCEIDEKTGQEKWFRKRLTPTEKELYRILKQSAGTQNKCWKTAEHLAEHVGCGNKTIGNAKKSLSQPFEQLDGLSLIDIETIRTATKDPETQKIINTKERHIISINDIWDYNAAFPVIKEQKFRPMKEEISKAEAEIAIEKMRQAQSEETNDSMRDLVDKSEAGCQSTLSRGTHGVNRHHATGGHNVNRHSKHTTPITDHIVNETDSSSQAAQIAFPSLCFSLCFSTESEARRWLKNLGVSSHLLKTLNIANNLQKLRLSAEYLLQCFIRDFNKGKPITNLPGYFLNIYKKEWYKS